MLRFAYIALTFILVFKLSTINVLLPYPEYAAGETAQIIKTQTKLFKQKNIPAVLSVQSIKEYDSLTFVGDVLLARNVEYLMSKEGGDYPFKGLDVTQFSAQPAVVANFEATVPEIHQPTPTGQIDFSVSESALPYLKDVGYTHLSLGNNHSFDFGNDGYLHSIKMLENTFEVFGQPVGLSSNSLSLLDVQDMRVALIGIHGLLKFNIDELSQIFAYAESKSDIQIVYVHWGEEYALRQNNEQREMAKLFIKNGADLIVGHHPHVVQGIEVIDGVPVFYSLGNYIFDQYFSKDVQQGLLLSLYFDDGINIAILPVSSESSLSQPRLMSPEHHSAFLEKIALKSDSNVFESIKNGYIKVGGSVATSTKIAMITDIF